MLDARYAWASATATATATWSAWSAATPSTTTRSAPLATAFPLDVLVRSVHLKLAQTTRFYQMQAHTTSTDANSTLPRHGPESSSKADRLSSGQPAGTYREQRLEAARLA